MTSQLLRKPRSNICLYLLLINIIVVICNNNNNYNFIRFKTSKIYFFKKASDVQELIQETDISAI